VTARTARLRPSVASGEAVAPPSKSYTHRALVAARLSARRYSIERPLDAEDTRRTVMALRRLGSSVRTARSRWTVEPRRSPLPRGRARIDCGESGTTLRFACALAALGDRPVEFTGEGRLAFRPMDGLVAALEEAGVSVERPPSGRSLPLTVRGPMHGGRLRVGASESSQFTSALLLALPTVAEDSTLLLEGRPVSVPYVEATEAVLRAHRVRVDPIPRGYRIPGGQHYRGGRFVVPGDASSAAYLWAAGAVTGGEVRVRGVPSDWPQADLAVLDLLERFGASVRRTPDGAAVRGGRRRPFRLSLTSSPDLYPLAGVLAATAVGESRLLGAPQIEAKESNRRLETARLARAMGASVRSVRGGLAIRGAPRVRRFALRGLSDHRIVMSAAVGALVAEGPCTLADASAVAKSFPGFFDALGALVGPGTVR
jgi:3-phosphoshikimate 1-carboxyvinyltransferase